MKKGIVMEVHQDFIILMTKEGEFEKGTVLDEYPEIGEEVHYQPFKQKQQKTSFCLSKSSSLMKLLPMVCILFLLILPLYLIPGNNEVFAYVMIDINPSIELEIDADYHVQTIRPLNKDAATIIQQLEFVKGEKAEVIIDAIMDTSETAGLINDEKNMLLGISFVDDDEEQTVSENLRQFSDAHDAEWNIATFIVPKNVRDEALENNVSMNKVMSDMIKENKDSDKIMAERERFLIKSFYKENEEQNLIESFTNDEQLYIKGTSD